MGCVSITNTIDVQHNVAAVAQNAKDTQRRKSNYPQSLSDPPLRLPHRLFPCVTPVIETRIIVPHALDIVPGDILRLQIGKEERERGKMRGDHQGVSVRLLETLLIADVAIRRYVTRWHCHFLGALNIFSRVKDHSALSHSST